MTSSKPNSRFSTLKVFKFKPDTSIPPPPPPKDPQYLTNKNNFIQANRSLASLSPDSLSIPSTPLSPQFLYSKPTTDASHSAVSLISNGEGITSQGSEKGKKKAAKSRGVFGFGRKTSKGPPSIHSSVESEEIVPPPPPQEDENISMPWNFQHHIHVDEGYVGLPPSWTSSLKNAGFTDNEIHAIQTRRTPLTPAPRSADLPVQGVVVTRPLPRSTSLPRRQFSGSNTSLPSQVPKIPPVPTMRSSPTPSVRSRKTPPPRQYSDTSDVRSHRRKVSDASSFSIDQYHQANAGSFSSDDQYVYVETDAIPSTIGHGLEHVRSGSASRNASRSASRAASRAASSAPSSRSGSVRSRRSVGSDRGRFRDTIMPLPRPQTPPKTKKGFHVVNGSPPGGLQSPPPAYTTHHGSGSGSGSGWLKEKQAGLVGSSSSPPRIPTQLAMTDASKYDDGREDDADSEESGNSVVQSLRNQTIDGLKMSPIPPRLSFHESSGEWDGWAESLISSIPGVDDEKGKRHQHQSSTSSASRRHQKRPSTSSRNHQRQPSTSSRRHENQASTSYTSRGRERQPSASNHPPQQQPVTNSVVLAVPSRDSDAPQLVTPLWNELMGLVQVPNDQMHSTAEDGEWTPAISESHSPTLPVTVTKSSSGALSPNQDVDRNRDSGMSVSTITGIDTEAVVVSGVRAVGTRAVAVERTQAWGTTETPLEEDAENLWAKSLLESETPRGSLLGSESTALSNRPGLQTAISEFENEDGILVVSPNSPGLGTPTTPGLPYMRVSGTEMLLNSGVYDEDGDAKRPSIVIQQMDSPLSPLTPARTYPGWVSQVVAPLEEFIDKRINPRAHYVDLTEIAEGESGSVFAASVIDADKLRLPAPLSSPPPATFTEGMVAIKNVPLLPCGSTKLDDLQKELKFMKGVRHENLLEMEKLYVDKVDDSLWIRMELMERSLADVVQLVQEGLMVQERMIARFASDALLGLQYLQTKYIAHRDVRSDNLLLNRDGVLKIADFSSAVKVTPEAPMCSEPAGVIYWQAPEMRSGPYNALQVDVWSIGATVWEMAQTEPPFANIQDPTKMGKQWPPISQPELYSRSFHDFLRSCSQPASIRQDPATMLNSPFIQNACGRRVVIQLLSQCRAIEERMVELDNGDPGSQ